jgi:hypothetical protein
MRNVRKKVNWLPGAKEKKVITPPHPLLAERGIDEYINSASLKEGLIPGALWFTHCDLLEEGRYVRSGYTSHPFPYVTHSHAAYAKGTLIPSGSTAIYLGIVRLEEESSKKALVRVLRHAFLVGGKQYITNDIGKYFYPA